MKKLLLLLAVLVVASLSISISAPAAADGSCTSGTYLNGIGCCYCYLFANEWWCSCYSPNRLDCLCQSYNDCLCVEHNN